MTMDGVGHEVGKWDLLIAHPPCTYLSNAGARHLWKGHELQADRVMLGIQGRDLFMRFWWADIPKICVENPVPSRVFCLPEYTQSIQPYQFGHPYTKKTCLWLKGLSSARKRQARSCCCKTRQSKTQPCGMLSSLGKLENTAAGRKTAG